MRLKDQTINQDSVDNLVKKIIPQSQKKSCRILTLNAEIYIKGFDARHYDWLTADGIGVVWALRLKHSIKVPRVTGVDVSIELLKHCKNVFLLGATKSNNEQACQNLRVSHAQLNVSGRHGYFSNQEWPDILAEIKREQPDLILIGMGHPRQEQIADQIQAHLKRGVMMGVGGVIDVLAGKKKEAPKWIQKIGLEWGYSMILQPTRLNRIKYVIQFMVKMISEK